MKKWDIQQEIKNKNSKVEINEIIDVLLQNRGITNAKEKEQFLHPHLEEVTAKNVGLDSKQLKKALTRIKKAIQNKEQIIVFGDYDVDGITGTAILWETLHALNANVKPYIPHRVDEGYGLSKIGIENVLIQSPETALIITVDNGIVAHEAVDFANEKNIDVILTDHHTASEALPNAYAIVHTTKLCGAGVAYVLSKELNDVSANADDTHLELATLGTIADLVPLTKANRAIVKHGLAKVSNSKRPGLQALYQQAGIVKDMFDTYEIGFIIAPRLNAAGRIENAMDSLRLLCTTSKERAEMLAEQLELTNRERQQLMRQATQHASLAVKASEKVKNILVIAHETYPQGVIGLVAGKLVEEYYRPAIVIAIGEKHSKASARSINGFNIIEFLRSHETHFVNVGGHPMAAGFTVETEKITILQQALETSAEQLLTDDHFTRVLKIDCELPFSLITKDLYKNIQNLSPFGMGNPEPVFASYGVTVEQVKIMGKESNHLKLQVNQDNNSFDAIAFGMGELGRSLNRGDKIDLAYTIDENTWNGNTKLQLKIKDIH